MRIPFVGPFSESQTKLADAQRTVNFYPELLNPGAKSPAALYPTPGVTTFTTVPDAPIRGLFEHNGRVFVVAGAGFYEIESTGTCLLWGAVASGTTPVTFSTNGFAGNQLFLTVSGNGYIFNLTTHAFSTVLTGTAQFGAFVDGYFLALDTTASRLQASALNDGMSWPALAIGQRNTAADPWVSMIASNREVWLFGQKTSDVWYNSGAPGMPFEPIGNVGAIQVGSASPYSTVSRFGGAVAWLGANEKGTGIVFRSSGLSVERISTQEVERVIQSYGNTSDAVGWSYQMDGHEFYVLSFPTQKATWVFDAATSLWHERGWWNGPNAGYEASRQQFHCYGFNKHLVGHRTTGVVAQLANTSTSDTDAASIRRLRRGPHVSAEGTWLFHNYVQVDLEVGIGSVAGSDPQLMLRWSDDGGKTWSPEMWRSAGKIGEYRIRAMWHRLGRSRDRIYELVVSDAALWHIVDFFGDISPGRV